MPAITVQWYGPLRERSGCDSERLASAATTPEALWCELSAGRGWPARSELALAVAVDDELAAWDAPLRDGAVVAFLPPVAGG